MKFFFNCATYGFSSTQEKLHEKSNTIDSYHRRINDSIPIKEKKQTRHLSAITVNNNESIIDKAQDYLFCQSLKLCHSFGYYGNTPEQENDEYLIKSTRSEAQIEKYRSLPEIVTILKTEAGMQKLKSIQFQKQMLSIITFSLTKGLPPRKYQEDYALDKFPNQPSRLEMTYFLLSKVIHIHNPKYSIMTEMNEKLCRQLISLFDSENEFERNQLKAVLHHVYKKFGHLRKTIQAAIANEFLMFVYETQRHDGIREMLCICEAIVCGLMTPIKKKNVEFLFRVLIPLHRPKTLHQYHDKLFSCIILFTVKEPSLTVMILRSIMKIWPWRNYEKQLLFLKEFEALLEFLVAAQLQLLKEDLSNFFARLLNENHFEVTVRTLMMWDNKQLAASILGQHFAAHLLPKIFACLEKLQHHWSSEVQDLAKIVLSFYEDMAPNVYQFCAERYEDSTRIKEEIHFAMKRRWQDFGSKVAL